RALSRQAPGPAAFPGHLHSGRGWLGVHGRVRGRLPAQAHRPPSATAALTRTQWPRRALAGYLAPRVLRRLRPAPPDRSPHPLIGAFAHRYNTYPTTTHLDKSPAGVSRNTASRGDPAVSYVLTTDTGLTQQTSAVKLGGPSR